jgi:homeobox protein cut-like
MARLRRMETEVMTGRRRIAELEGERACLENEKRSAEARVVELSALTSRLEDDLARVASKGGGDVMAEGTVGSHSRTPSVPPGRGPSWKAASFRDEEDLDVDMHELLSSTTQAAPALGASPSASLDLVRILQAQRDRYKARTRELEGRLAAVEQESGRHKAQAESMLRDNLKLYEKVRFLQSYKKGRVGPGALDSAQDKRMSGLEHSALHQRNVANDEGKEAQECALEAGRVPTGAGAAATEARYRAMYEEQMNPFTAFSVAERVRKYQDLSVIDKITLQTTRAFLAHKKARMAVFFYALSLHLLVFLTLYMWGHHHCTDLHNQADALMGHPPEPLGMQSLSMGSHTVGGGANHLQG